MIEVFAFGLALIALADRVWRRRKAHRPRAVYLGLPPARTGGTLDTRGGAVVFVPYRCSTCGFDHDRGDMPCWIARNAARSHDRQCANECSHGMPDTLHCSECEFVFSH
jgi:hypothetical protein